MQGMARVASMAPRTRYFILASPALGFADGVRRITMPAPGGRTVSMAVITAPDGVLVELIGPAT